jgi:hypothetical protein
MSIRTILLSGTAALAATSLLASSPLLRPAPGTLTAVAPATRARAVDVDLQALPAGEAAGQRLRLDLFDDARLEVVLERSERQQGATVWHGRVEGRQGSSVALAVAGRVLIGNVKWPGAWFGLRVVDQQQAAVQFDEAALPLDHPDEEPTSGPEAGASVPLPAAAEAPGAFDVLVAYTPAARTAMGGTDAALATAALAVAETNQAYRDSGINARFNLVHAYETEYTEPASNPFGAALSAFAATADGQMDEVHTLRNTYRADFSALMINSTQYCGIAYLMTTPSASWQSSAFSVTYWGCATGYYSFGHEIGHNMGCRHDWAVDSGTTPYPYGHGYVQLSTSPAWRTVLAYANACGSCTRIGRFSNPDRTYNGLPTGVPEDQPNPSNNVHTINNNLPLFAGFRLSGIDTPADFDGDRISNLVVHRLGSWLFHDFASGTYLPADSRYTGAPSASCIPLMLDHDGDGRDELAHYCGGAWHFYNDDGSYLKGVWTGAVAGDVPVPADYDGDGRDEVAVFRAGAWLRFNSDTGALVSAVWTGLPGGSGVPVPLDHDGDRRAEYAVYAGGAFHLYNDDGSYDHGVFTGQVAGDVPVPGDYDGNRSEEPAVFRSGAWLIFDAGSGALTRAVFTGTGGAGSLPAPVDVDGDAALDLTVHGNGAWHFYNPDGSYRKGIWTGAVAGDRALSRRPN